MYKIIRITTVPGSLSVLLTGQLRYISDNGFEVIAVSSPGESLMEVAINEKVKTVAISMTRKITPFKDLRALLQLYRLMRKEKPEIVHTHTPKAGLLGVIAARLAGVPHRLHTVAGMPLTVETGFRRLFLNYIEKLTYACATKVYPNSYGLKDIILKNSFAKEKKLKVIGNGSSNGIDTSIFDPSLVTLESKRKILDELNLAEDSFIFLFVGRVVEDKGIKELIKAFTNLNKTHSNSHLIIVGGYERQLNPLSPELVSTIDEHSNIHHVGYKKNVLDYFGLADVFTFPSYREGFPNVVLQAAALQLNCIVSDINGCNEIITNGDNGWIVPSKNVEELEDRMRWCLENKEKSKRMGLKSRKIIQRNYERSFVQAEILKEYRTLLDFEK